MLLCKVTRPVVETFDSFAGPTRIQVTFGLLIQNFRAVLTCYNSSLLTLATLHSQNSGFSQPIYTK